jgi:quercetin dioxygenase-like cupin family protein
MRQLAAVLIIAALAIADTSCTGHRSNQADGRARSDTSATAGAAGMPAQGMFRPEQVVWKDGPPSLPAGAKVAVLEGDPAKPGYFAMRLKFPDGYRVMPHTHPNVERVTIIQGTLHLGMGGTFDESAAHTLPAGSYSFMPPGMKHYAWAEGETVLQLATMGPWQINYLNPSDDPRKKK